MTKITLTDLANLQNETTAVNAINANNAILETASDNTLSRDGTSPNEMESVLDMNSHQIVNLPNPSTENSPLRLKDLADFIGTGVVNTLPDGGTTGQVLTKISNADYDADWAAPILDENTFLVSNYATAQDAIDAAIANNGGTVVFDEDYTIPPAGLDLVDVLKPIRLTSYSNQWSGPASTAVNLFYNGAGTAIDARGSWYLEIDHILLVCNGTAPAKIVDLSEGGTPGSGAVGAHIHNCGFQSGVLSATTIAIDLEDTQFAIIEDNVISCNGGIGIQGIPTGGLWSVKALINNNLFPSPVAICVKGPGQTWTISNNTFQSNLKLVTPAPAGRTDTLTFSGNWAGDYFAGPPILVETNAENFFSYGNTYASNAGGTCIKYTNSTGKLTSIGDRFDSTTAIDLGTGNYISVTNPSGAFTTLYSGTPASSARTLTRSGTSQHFGRIDSGSDAGVAGAGLRMYSDTAGANYAEIIPPTGVGVIGTCSNILPTTSGTLLNTSNNVTVTDKVFNNTNIFFVRDDRFTLQDSGDVTKQVVFQLSGLTTATTRTLTVPDASTTLVGTDATQTLTNKTLGATTLSGTISGGGNQINNVIIGTSTPLAGTFTTLAATTSVALTNNTNGVTTYVTTNNSSGASASAYFEGNNGTNSIRFGMRGTAQTNFGVLQAGRAFIYGAVPFAIVADGNDMIFATKGAAGESMRLSTAGGLSINTTTDAGVGALLTTAHIRSNGATSGIGYATGAGGTVTQTTGKTASVTLDKVTGQITMHNASLAAGAHATFQFNNSSIAATDVVIVNIKSGASLNSYVVGVDTIAAGSCNIHLYNTTAGALAEAVVLQYAVIKGVNS